MSWVEKIEKLTIGGGDDYSGLESMGDATGSIAAKVGAKMILYYSFLLCDKTRISEH